MNEDNKKIREFTDLHVWKEGHEAVLMVYDLTKRFPKEESFGLASQMRRAAVSVTSNIAEGFGRHSFKEKIQFYYLAQGSLVELKNQILISKDVSYISNQEYEIIKSKLDSTHQLLQGLIGKSKSFLPLKSFAS